MKEWLGIFERSKTDGVTSTSDFSNGRSNNEF